MNKINFFFCILTILLDFILSETSGEVIRDLINEEIKGAETSAASLINKLSLKGIKFNDEDGDANYCGHISYIDNQLEVSCGDLKLPQINITQECKKKIIEKYNPTNIIVTTVFKKKEFEQSSDNYKAGVYGTTDILSYQLFVLKDNKVSQTLIDIYNICVESVTLFTPLYLDETLKNKFVAVAGQNPKTEIEHLRDYDIFDPNAKIYKDICYTVTYSLASENIINKEESFKNYDISLYERKLYYYPGKLYLCPDSCEYLGTDKDTLSPMCECQYMSYLLDNQAVNEHNAFIGFEFDENKFNKTKKDNYLTIEVFKCIKLPFTKTGFKNNYGSIIILTLIAIVLLCYLILVISGKYHLLSVLELLYNSNIQSMNYIKSTGFVNPNNNFPQNQIPFDARSNNYLLSSQRGINTNGLLMSNVLTGNKFINGNTIQVGKSKSNSKNNMPNVNQNTSNKKDKIQISNVEEVKENDFESEKNSDKDKTDIGNSKSIEKNEVDVVDKDVKNKKANPPKRTNFTKYIKNNKSRSYHESNPPKKKNANGGENGNEDVERNGKKKKTKNPIEIALNVKDLREMMFKNQPQLMKSLENGNPQNNNNNNNNIPQQNGNGFNPFNMGFMPPPPFGGGFPLNEDAIRKDYENRAKQRELELQKELAELKEKERRREMDNMYERERQRQRDLDYERERRRDRDDYYRDRSYGGNDRLRDEELYRERERLNQQNNEIQQMKEKLQKEYNDKQMKDKERDLELQKELTKARDLAREKEVELEKELLKQKQALMEQYEKENKDLIEKKDREIQLLREEKDREIQRLKEDKEREVKIMKEDMDRDKKQQDEELKKKEKQFQKEKQKLKEMQKGLTNNSFFNNSLQQQMLELNNLNEKPETPQIVVPIDSIFTDQELNAMDFKDSNMYDKRTLCQVYFSLINRKQPLFFLFNYNSSSSSSLSTFQIKYGAVKFIIFCVEIMIYFFFYATFFGSKSITHILKQDFKFKKRFIFAIILSPICMIVKSIIHHFVYDGMNKKIAEIKMRCYTNFIVGKKKENVKVNQFKDFWESDEEDKNKDEDVRNKKEESADIAEIENDNLPEFEKIMRKEKYEKRKLKLLIKDLITLFKRKIWISFIIMILVMFVEWVYISAFCAVYKNTQLNFFINIIISFGLSNFIPFIYCLIPTIFRLDAVREDSKFSFFIYKIFLII